MGCGASSPAAAAAVTRSPRQSPAAAAGGKDGASALVIHESRLEEAYSGRAQALGGGAVKVVAKLVGATGFPGAEVVAGLMTAIVEAADTAKANMANCKQVGGRTVSGVTCSSEWFESAGPGCNTTLLSAPNPKP